MLAAGEEAMRCSLGEGASVGDAMQSRLVVEAIAFEVYCAVAESVMSFRGCSFHMSATVNSWRGVAEKINNWAPKHLGALRTNIQHEVLSSTG